MGHFRQAWLGLLGAGMVVVLYLIFLGSPEAAVLGPSQRIFYVHMGAAAAAGVAYTITAASSVLYLGTRRLSFDRWAAASAEIGTVFTTMLLISGILWGRAAWGVWWTWDPRLTATVILWVLFMGYLMVRQWTDSRERRARLGAVLALAAYVDVPIDYMTIRWWKSIHPVVITTHGINMAPAMMAAMFAAMTGMLLLMGAWMQLRLSLMRAEWGLEDARNRMRSMGRR